MSTKTKILIVVVILVVAFAVYYFFFKKDDTTTAPIIGAGGAITPADAAKEVSNDNFPINQGMRGPNIRRLQTALNWIDPKNNLTVDGIFGSRTYTALKTTVDVQLSRLPMDEKSFNTIIAMGNRSKGA